MDVIDLVRTVVRRWYVMLPVLLLAAGLAYTVASTAESQYEVTGSFLLTDASLIAADAQAPTQASVSPRVVVEVVQGEESRGRVAEQGGTADYEVLVGEADGLARITAMSSEEQAAVTTVGLVIEEIRRELTERQGDLPEHRRSNLEVLSVPSTARQQVVGEGTEAEAVRYVATGSVQFLAGPEQGANPYTASFTGTIRILEEVMASPQVRQEIASSGGRGLYEVAMRPRDTAPIINISARSNSPDRARDTFGIVADRVAVELRMRQEAAGAPASLMLTLQPLSVPTDVSVLGGELRRPLIVIIGLGLVAAVSLAVLVEGLASRSRRRVRSPLEPVDGSMPGGDGSPTPKMPQPLGGA